MSRAVTEVTHNHPEGIKGAEATAVCVFLARQVKSKDEIKAYVSEHYYPLDFTVDEIRSSYDFHVSCQGAVPQALEAFFELGGDRPRRTMTKDAKMCDISPRTERLRLVVCPVL